MARSHSPKETDAEVANEDTETEDKVHQCPETSSADKVVTAWYLERWYAVTKENGLAGKHATADGGRDYAEEKQWPCCSLLSQYCAKNLHQGKLPRDILNFVCDFFVFLLITLLNHRPSRLGFFL